MKSKPDPTPKDRAQALLLNNQVSTFVNILNEAFPESSPDPKDTDREVWVKAGERRAIRTLLQWREDAEKKILEQTIVRQSGA